MAELTTEAPEGATFAFEEVKTDRGAKSLGFVPLLQWQDVDALREYYGDEGVLDVIDGTSLRVSFQSIARRMRIAEKSDDEIAKAMIEFRPGKRAVGASTPASRAKRAAGQAAEKLGDQADAVTELLKKVASGEIDSDKLQTLLSMAE